MSAAGTLGAPDDKAPAPPPSKKRRRAEEGEEARAAATAAGAGDGATASCRHLRRIKQAPTMAACPACGNVAKPDNMMRHLRACCPDHLQTPEAAPLAARADEEREEARAPAAAAEAAPDADATTAATIPEALRALLEAVARQEGLQRRRILKLTFMVEEREREQQQQQKQQQQEVPLPLADAPAPATTATPATASRPTSRRRPLPEVARLMALPERRAARLLDRAMRTIEMPRDPDPALRVLHECARFLAVAKPAGVPTTPAHRWRGGSMVNRLLWYGEQGRGGEEEEEEEERAPFEPRVLHRLDLDTSGVLLCAKDARAAAAAQAALAGRARGGGDGGDGGAEKTYVALAYGWPPPWLPRPSASSPCAEGPDPASPPPPGVTAVVAAGGAGDEDGDGGAGGAPTGPALLTFDVDAAIGRHPGSAVGRRVAEDAKPSFAAAAEGEREEGGKEEGVGGSSGGGRRRGGRRRGGGGDGGSDKEEEENEEEEEAFLPSSTRFVVLAAASEPPPGARALFPSLAEAGKCDGSDPTAPAPLACDASRAATLATFGPPSSSSSSAAPPRRRCCLLLASLRTGRTHQIRLHLAHAGLPIAGDELYACALRPLLPRQALHAWRLRVGVAGMPPPPPPPVFPASDRGLRGRRSRAPRGVGGDGDGEEGEEGRAAGQAPPPPPTTTPTPTAVLLDLKAPLPDDMLRAARELGVPVPAWLL